MQTITPSTTLKNQLIASFDLEKDSLFGDLDLRIQAINSFEKQGIPTRKSEEYKYVPLELLLKDLHLKRSK